MGCRPAKIEKREPQAYYRMSKRDIRLVTQNV
jgi:hypothetical protein